MKKISLVITLLFAGIMVSTAQLSAVHPGEKTSAISHRATTTQASARLHQESNHTATFVHDVGMVHRYPSEYTMIPSDQLQPISISAQVANLGTSNESHVGYEINVFLFQNGMFAGLVYSNTSDTASTLNVGDTSAVLNAGSFTPADTGIYLLQYVSFMDSADLATGNDTLQGFIVVTDSAYARDYAAINDSLNNSLGFTTGTGTLGQSYHVYASTAITSVTFYLSNNQIGDNVSACIYSLNGAGIPFALLRNTPVYTITAADTGGTFLTLSFANPVAVSPGGFFAGVNQLTAGHNLGLGHCNNIYTPGTAFYRSGVTWVRIDSTTFHGSFIVRPNTNSTILATPQITPETGVEIYPNPSSGIIHFTNTNKSNRDFIVAVYNYSGEKVGEYKFNPTIDEASIDLSNLPAGNYSLMLSSDKGVILKKFVILPH